MATSKPVTMLVTVETFQWRDEEASRLAHEIPEVMAIWEPMVTVLEDLKHQVVEPMATSEVVRSRSKSRGRA